MIGPLFETATCPTHTLLQAVQQGGVHLHVRDGQPLADEVAQDHVGGRDEVIKVLIC